MNPVREALYGALVTDVELAGLLSTPTAIYHRTAPQAAAYPLIILHEQASTDRYAMSPDPLTDELWTIKAVDRDSSSSVAEDIAARICLVLNDAQLALDSGALLYLRRAQRISYGEIEGGKQLHHVGGQYRAVIDSA